MNGREKTSGFTLVETMLALSISLVAIGGALGLFAHASAMYRASVEASSLNEAAYSALVAIRRDVEQIGFLGFAEPDGVRLDTSPETAAALATCGSDWLEWPLHLTGGTDNDYTWRCPAYARSPMPGADTLLVRHVEPETADVLEAGRIYLGSSTDGTGQLVAAQNNTRLEADPSGAMNTFSMSGYYVSASSAGDSGSQQTPSLRAKRLSIRNKIARLVDEEIQPGIEDLQIEFGIGSTPAGTGEAVAIEKFVSAHMLMPTDRVLAVRVWLLARSATRQNRVTPSSVPAYADRAQRNFSDGYPRRLVSTTIATRRALRH